MQRDDDQRFLLPMLPRLTGIFFMTHLYFNTIAPGGRVKSPEKRRLARVLFRTSSGSLAIFAVIRRALRLTKLL
jgi:hypothetical protein